jgi:cysteine-rich repeat protein
MIEQPNETCDDGNTEEFDGCGPTCQDEICGDGIPQPPEECDDANANNNDACKNDCTGAVCGDQIVQEMVEDCDDGNLDNTDDCIACQAAICGDGFQWAGMEECDDGDGMDGNACTNACTDAECGDNIEFVGVEECDDGLNGINTDACVDMCEDAACGDGYVWEGVEDCDDDNLDNTDMCTNQCEFAACGDGFVQAGEECDDGDLDPLDGCSPMCAWEARLVFVTSTVYTGNLMGIQGADIECNLRALAAGLPGTYAAWISTNVNNVPVTPANRFVHSAVPYFMTNGTKVADNWADLTDGTLDAPIDRTEFAGMSPATLGLLCGLDTRLVRTGTASDGTLGVNVGRCNNFTQAGGSLGSQGSSTSATGTWSVCGGLQSCTIQMPIYCFQQ